LEVKQLIKMIPLDQEWLIVVGRAIGKSKEDVVSLIEDWWKNNKSLSFINNELIRLAEINGKKLILVDQNKN
jgi:hypothetical protein